MHQPKDIDWLGRWKHVYICTFIYNITYSDHCGWSRQALRKRHCWILREASCSESSGQMQWRLLPANHISSTRDCGAHGPVRWWGGTPREAGYKESAISQRARAATQICTAWLLWVWVCQRLGHKLPLVFHFCFLSWISAFGGTSCPVLKEPQGTEASSQQSWEWSWEQTFGFRQVLRWLQPKPTPGLQSHENYPAKPLPNS